MIDMILKINGSQIAAADPPPEIHSYIPAPEDAFMSILEVGRDQMNGWTAETAQWILVELGKVLKEMGLWLLQVAPDTFILLGMVFCLGAIANIKKSGALTVGAVIVGVLLEAVRGSVFGV